MIARAELDANDNQLRIDRAENAEPMDRMLPAEPIERIEPVDPIDRMLPVEPMERMEPEELRDFSDVAMRVAQHRWLDRGTREILPHRHGRHVARSLGTGIHLGRRNASEPARRGPLLVHSLRERTKCLNAAVA